MISTNVLLELAKLVIELIWGMRESMELRRPARFLISSNESLVLPSTNYGVKVSSIGL